MFKKLRLLWKLLDSVEVSDNDIIIRTNKNLKLNVAGHLVYDIKKSCVLSTGTSEGHLLYLNPISEQIPDDGASDDIVDASKSAHQQSMQNRFKNQ